MSSSHPALQGLSSRSQTCIQRLLDHRASPLATYPPNVKQAAVLVALFERPDRSDGLRVLLTTRARHLRSHPGQTALPGGKIDADDAGPVEAARREAWEEVGLSLDPSDPNVRLICTLDPFLSKYKLVVHPVVCVLSSSAVVDALKPSPDEVAGIFEHPLEALLDGKWEGDAAATPSERGGTDWPYEEEYYNHSDVPWLADTHYRMHRFRTSATPIKGLTADVLLTVASIAYDRSPAVPALADTQWPFAKGVAAVVAEAERANRGESASGKDDASLPWLGGLRKSPTLTKDAPLPALAS